MIGMWQKVIFFMFGVLLVGPLFHFVVKFAPDALSATSIPLVMPFYFFMFLFLGILEVLDILRLSQLNHFYCYFGCEPTTVFGFMLIYIAWVVMLLIPFVLLLWWHHKHRA